MSKKKVLVVDDEIDIQFVLKLQLQQLGYDVIVASDGNDGLAKARKENPDLIILDLMLPKLDGYKVCRMLKFDAKYKHIPVIIFTARGMKEDEKLGYEVGANAYLTKPFERDVLIETMNNLLGGSSFPQPPGGAKGA